MSRLPIEEAARGTFSPEAPSAPPLVRLGAGYEFDPALGNPEALIPAHLRGEEPADGGRGYYLIQFRGPVTPQDREQIEAEDGSIFNYVPDYAFLASLSGDARDRLAASERVAWIGLYQPAYKISTLPQMQEPGTRELVILLFPDVSIDAAAQAVTGAGALVKERSDNGINKMLLVEMDPANLAPVVRVPAVAWIEPRLRPEFYNDQCQWVVQTWVNGSRRVWDMGIRGQGEVISVADSGIRTAHNQFFDTLVPISNFGDFPGHRKVIAYQKTTESTSITFGDESLNSHHGTHTSCTAAGDDSPHAADLHDGMSKEAKIYFLDGGGTSQAGVFIPIDLNDMFILPYNGNLGGAARIMTNSWGTANGGAYDLQSMAADQFMWNHPDFLSFFASGNSGGPNTVGSPATAKNIVTAGGTGNGANANTIYSGTSRGPTDDGRFKPTICAPATLTSANGSGNTGYKSLTGTSMSTPAMAGATVLIRQYLTDGWYPTGTAVPGNSIPAPSAALMKAMAVNSGEPDVGSFTVPDNNIGWGRINDDAALHFSGDVRRLALIDNTEGLLTGEFVEYQVYVASNLIPLKATLVWTDYPGTPSASVQLVNNLHLTAMDGTNTYKGNVYSGGQSQTGGSYDNLNVEENVRRNSPAIGLWTFRIEAQNVPVGPQPFALVVTGGLASDQATLALDKATYSGSDDLGIRVIDTNAGATVTVTITSDTEPATENLVISGGNGVYQGTLPLSLGYPNSGDGELSVSDGDQITVTYQDANPVTLLTAEALVNISGPAISDVRASAISDGNATVAWITTTPANSKVYYGTTPGLGSETPLDAGLVLNHAVVLPNLNANTTYYYDVESYDNQGNGVRDSNGGAHYTFSTDLNRDILLVIGDGTFDKKNYYTNAFARTGWTFTTWEAALAAQPPVGNLATGMASFKAVIWQTGLEQYPMVNDVARDSISALMDKGSRLAMFSHDVAWDFCDPASPDFNAARCTWMQEELHATYQVDPVTWSQVRGIALDPISGAYTAGIPYSPHRDGAAGDEINGIATGGSFAYVWRNNEATADDIALRWTGSSPVGIPSESVWGGTPNKVSSNFFEWAHLNASNSDDVTRADVLDKTLIWLIGHDHPSATIVAPNGGENFIGNSISISWTEAVDGGFSVASRKLYYSYNGGDEWILITASPGTSPYSWNITSIPNGAQYRVRMVLADNGTPALLSSDASNANFTINRPGGDTRPPVVLAGSMAVNPNPVLVPNPATLTARISDVYTGNSNITAAEWSKGAAPAPPGTGTAMSGSFTSPLVDVSAVLNSGALDIPTTKLWVRGRDAAGLWSSASSLTVQVNSATAVDEGATPARFALHANAPNPFNPITLIRFDLPRATETQVEVFDLAGRKIRTLVDGVLPAGARSVLWDGRDSGGRDVGSGVYFYRLEAGGFRATKKMTLLK